MKNSLMIILSALLLMVVVLSITYAIKNNQTKSEWNERFDRCKDSINEQEQKASMEQSLIHFADDEMIVNHIQNELNELNQCVEEGGCYTCRPCNLSPKLHFAKFLLDFFTDDGMCTSVCNYFCMHPSDYY